ncbi:hypothetical protein BJ875DRAFT_489656 [Amylocarpus encephaloides]|uniref:WW domain-containing protein n=1 Tax=Amylocarpus encephaloides TaxID=45428 RepID=A0A9P8BZV4_9HELO|nr:hypothetical protein BJ875DRAFT_489656 [Amylocarpus encephaloides]
MSPTAFKQQIDQFITELHRCLELCDAVLRYRRLGSTHLALDQLQDGLALSSRVVSSEFMRFRTQIGPRMDLGDELSRNYLNRAIREVKSDVQTRLHDIAYREGPQDKTPGFGQILKKVDRITDEITIDLSSLALRLEATKPKPAPEKLQKPKLKHDEVIVSLEELDMFMSHMKNSWKEKETSEGRRYWVNHFDDKVIVWERPEGFVNAMPVKRGERKEARRFVRTPTWEQEQAQKGPRQRRQREDVWQDSRAW